MSSRLSVKTRIAMWATFAMAGLAVAVTAVQWFVIESDIKSALVEQQAALAHRAADELDDKLRLRIRALEAGATLFSADVLANSTRVADVTSQRLTLATLFDAIFVVDSAGTMLFDVPAAPGRRGISVADRSYFQQAMKTSKPAFSVPIVGKISRAPQIVIAVPILGADRRPIGALMGALFLERDNMLGRLRETRIGTTGRFALVTGGLNPVYVMHPDVAKTMQPVPAPERMLASEHGVPGAIGVFEELGPQGAPAFVAYASLETLPWIVAAEYPLEEAYGTIRAGRERITLLGAMFIATAALLLWVLLHRLLHPLTTMRDQLEQAMASQTLTTRLPVEGDEEFTALAQAFNSLMNAREKSENELRASRAQLRLVIDNVPAFIAYTNREERIEVCGGQSLKGMPEPATMVGKRVWEVLTPAAYENTEPHVRAALAGYRRRFERVDVRDGQTYWFQIDYVPDIRPSGEIPGFFSLVQDVTETRRIQASLVDSEQRFRLIANNLPALVSYIDRHMRIVFASAGFRDAHGIDPSTSVGQPVHDILDPDVWKQTRAHMELALSGKRERFERVVSRNGKTRIEQVDYVPHLQDGGGVQGVFSLIQDVTDTRRMQSELAENEQRIRLIADNVPALICYVDRAGIYRFNNKFYEVWLKRPLERITGHSVREVYGEAQFEIIALHLNRALQGERVSFGSMFTLDDQQRHVQGEWIPHRNADGHVIGVYGITHDVTSLKIAEQKLQLLAHSDTLTGLANRREFDEAFDIAAARARSNGGSLALLYIDVDYFKKINDTWGHATGDDVLKEFARRLVGSIRKQDIVARIAGDEFVILLEGLSTPEDALMVARKIVELVRSPFSTGRGELTVTASVGVAWAKTGDDAHRMMRDADRALYETKAAGRDGYTLAQHEEANATTPGRMTGRDALDLPSPLV